MSVDPLTKKYPMLTPYQFASNTPIWAIDLDGLEAFFVHGTMSNNKRWRDKNGNRKEVTNQLLRITPNKWVNTGFEWGGIGDSNGPFNSRLNRGEAAANLVAYIMENRVEGEDITLLGHSHGGNVSIQAVPLLRAALDNANASEVKINLVTIETPVDNNEGSVENPATHSEMINSHIHLFNELDGIQTKGANAFGGYGASFEREYTNEGTTNVEIDVSNIYGIGAPEVWPNGTATSKKKEDNIGAHSFDHDHPEVLKKNIDNGTIPKIK